MSLVHSVRTTLLKWLSSFDKDLPTMLERLAFSWGLMPCVYPKTTMQSEGCKQQHPSLLLWARAGVHLFSKHFIVNRNPTE